MLLKPVMMNKTFSFQLLTHSLKEVVLLKEPQLKVKSATLIVVPFIHGITHMGLSHTSL